MGKKLTPLEQQDKVRGIKKVKVTNSAGGVQEFVDFAPRNTPSNLRNQLFNARLDAEWDMMMQGVSTRVWDDGTVRTPIRKVKPRLYRLLYLKHLIIRLFNGTYLRRLWKAFRHGRS